MPTRPKLRSSCDGCGTAKVKCDRTQPECGRCASHSMKCVYGVSRKMGKPPREKMRLKTSTNKPGHDNLRGGGLPPPLGSGEMLDSVYSSIYHSRHGSLHNGMHGHDFADAHYHPNHPGLVAGLTCGPEAHVEDVLAAWDPLKHDNHHAGGGFLVNMQALDPLYGDYVDPTLPLLAAPDFGGEWSLQQDPSAVTGTTYGGYLDGPLGMGPSGPLATCESPGISSDASTGLGKATVPPAVAPAWSSSDSSTTTMTTRSDSVTSSSSRDSHGGGGGGGHDCVREAHDILASLSPAWLGRLLGAPGDAAAMATTAAEAGLDGVPLEAILQLNRKASGRLGRLLACGAGCARVPALALLCASIVARVLAWYRQAAASCAVASCSSSLSSLSWNGSCFGGGGGGGPAAATIAVADGAVLAPSGEAPAAAVPGGGDPHVMALGAFSIDDLRVQGALKMQLLAGEMRRAARLIDKFAAFAVSPAADGLSSSSSASLPSSPSAVFAGGASDGADTLCQGLEAWLRGEHARIDGWLRAQLQELSY